MKKLIVFILVLSLTLSLCSCFSKEVQESDIESSDVSDVEHVDFDNGVKLPNSAFTISTEAEHYFFDSTVTFRLMVNSEQEFTYGNEYYVEYFDKGVWTRCEKQFSFTEEAYVGEFEAMLSFTLSDRADPGKEKYRIIMPVSSGGHKYSVYSNEFTAE